MPTVADSVDAVVAGDTHVDTTSLCVVSPVGAVLDEITIDNDEQGYAEVVTWILRVVPSGRFVVGLEGTRSYGAGLCRALEAVGVRVVEVERPSRGERGRRGKSDPGDAVLAARKVLAMVVEREQMTRQRTQLNNQLLAELLTGTAEHQAMRRKGVSRTDLEKLAKARCRGGRPIDEQARMVVLRRKASEIVRLDQQIRDNGKSLKTIIQDVAPQLLEQVGVGPVVAAQLIVSYSHHGRCRDEAAFAALAGASPVPASSGRIVRHRLNRGGDRQLNRALHTIAVTRAQWDERSQDYIRRRSGQLTAKEIRRMLKRYIAREMFKILRTIETLNPAGERAPLAA